MCWLCQTINLMISLVSFELILRSLLFCIHSLLEIYTAQKREREKTEKNNNKINNNKNLYETHNCQSVIHSINLRWLVLVEAKVI